MSLLDEQGQDLKLLNTNDEDIFVSSAYANPTMAGADDTGIFTSSVVRRTHIQLCPASIIPRLCQHKSSRPAPLSIPALAGKDSFAVRQSSTLSD